MNIKPTLLAAATLLAPVLASAATISWGGAAGDWTTGANWTGGVVPGSGDIAAFGSMGSSGTPVLVGIDFTNSSTLNVGTIQSGGYVTFGASSSTSGVLSLTAVNGKLIDVTGNSVVIEKNVNGATGVLSLALGAGNISVGGANGALTINATMTGTNGLTRTGGAISFNIGGQNTFTGGLILKSSSTNLAFGTAGAPTSDIIAAANALTLTNNAGLRVTGGGASVSQSFAGTSLGQGHNTVTLSGTNGVAVNLGAITRAAGSTLALTNVAGGAINTTTGTASALLTANGAVYATVAGNDWAIKDASNTAIVGLSSVSGYTASLVDTLAGNADVALGVTSTTLLASANLSSLRINQAQVTTIDLGSNTLTTGGILVTSAVGARLSTITGGTLKAAGSGGELVVIHNGTNAAANALVIASTIADNGAASSFTKSGNGYVILSGNNTYSGGTYANGGSLQLNTATALGSGTLTQTGGTTIVFGNSVTVANNIAFANEYTGVANAINSNGNNAVLTGNLSSTANIFGISKTGTGSVSLRGNNTSLNTGVLNVTAGTLIAGSATALGSGGGNITISNGATLQIGETGFALATSTARSFTINGILDLATATGGNVTLTLSGAKTLALSATGVLKIGAGDQIILAGGGNSTILGTLNLNSEFDNVTGSQDYTLLVLAGGSTASGSFTTITGFDSSKVAALFDAATGKLTITAVPEPSAYGLLGAGALLAASFVRRRKTRA